MKVYLYNAITSEYEGSYIAQESPLEPGNFITPVLSTEVEPPAHEVNTIAVYINGLWALQSDYRGQTIFNQETGDFREVVDIGDIPYNHLLVTEIECDAILKSKADAAFNSLSYQDKRRSEYPPITDYLDGIVKGDQDQINKYIADCQTVKLKYPKS